MAVKETYKLKEDPEGSKYVGISLDWDYVKGEVHLSLPRYFGEALQCFKHIWTGKTEDQPYAHVTPNYGAKIRYAPDAEKSQTTTKEEQIFDEQVVEAFLYYGRAVDGTMLTALSAIASEQASPTEIL